MDKRFKKLNNIFGLVVFVIAASVYLLTMERHISFWDCGEYIVSSAKLGVTHAPGAALFQLIGAIWSGLAFGNGSLHPILINSLSALCSAFTILFLFWIITHFAKQLITSKSEQKEELSKSKMFTVLISGVVGALAFTFSDTFWYSAVEGEVYAMASCFTALIVWLACKWDANADSPRADKWLVLIAFVIGLSTGVHLMALLAVPIVGYIYYARKFKFSLVSFLIANAVIGLIFAIVFKVIFPLTMGFFGATEMKMVNDFGLPFNSGSFIAGFILIALFATLIYLSIKWKIRVMNTIVLSVVFMLIGFSCWLVIPIRANANPHMNLNNPDTALGTLDYFNREQYGDWPIFHGPAYTAHIENRGDGYIESVKDGAEYKKDEKKGRYEKLTDRTKPVYNKKHVQFFPKMYNESPEVMENYANRYGFPKFELDRDYRENGQANQIYYQLIKKQENGDLTIKELSEYAEILKIEPPTFGQQLTYFLDFQVGYMFIRYFMWNFAGRQNDWEGKHEVSRGNWISGIPFVDSIHLGDQELMPDKYKDNKSRNVYFLLPLILGLIGFFFQLNKNFSIWWGLLVMFILTSVGIIFYTSVKPYEPRERDYALVSSFFVFCIWIGLSVSSIISFIGEKLKAKLNTKTVGIVGAVCLFVPLLMGFQNWDDHDRSERKSAADFAYNYLAGLDDNSILFVYGDNDTYPLWGYQESTGFKKDAKVVNFTLLGAPWYIEQVHRKTYDANALPHSLKYEDYQISSNDFVQVLSERNILEMKMELSSPESIIFADSAIIRGVRNERRALLADLQQIESTDSITPQQAMKEILTESKFKKDVKAYRTKLKDVIYSTFQSNPQLDEQLHYHLSSFPNPDKSYNVLPYDKIVIPVNKQNVVSNGIVSPEDVDEIEDNIVITLKTRALYKSELAMLDLFAHYNWDRPIYFSGGGLYDDKNIFFLGDYLQYNGMSYKLVPIKTKWGEDGNIGRTNSKALKATFDKMKFGNLKDPNAWFDETGRNYTQSYRNIALRLATQLKKDGKPQEAEEVLNKIMEEVPLELYYWDSVLARIAALYIELGKEEKGNEIMALYKEKTQQHIDYFNSLDSNYKYSVYSDYSEAVSDLNLSVYTELKAYLEKKDTATAKSKFLTYYTPEKNKILALNKQLDAEPDNPVLNKQFEVQFTNVQELLGIANLIDTVYAKQEADTLFKQLVPEESLDLLDDEFGAEEALDVEAETDTLE